MSKYINTNGEKYSDGNMAYKARSINLEDINRVTKIMIQIQHNMMLEIQENGKMK